jgi:hypothetical protein
MRHASTIEAILLTAEEREGQEIRGKGIRESGMTLIA